jgi:hypothetical protein
MESIATDQPPRYGRKRADWDAARAKLSPKARELLRARMLAAIPSWYSPTAHMLVPSLLAVTLVTLAVVFFVHDLRVWQFSAIPLLFVMSNAVEWRAHKHVLHRRTPGLEPLYDRHTPIHHRLYITNDMAVRDRREFRIVLLPAFAILVIAATQIPIVAALALIAGRNFAVLAFATSMGYVLLYEWLHLSYHLPADSFIGRRKIIQILRRHHATHHSPDLMQKWNMNVSIPLWDWVRGTNYREEPVTSESRARPARDPV